MLAIIELFYFLFLIRFEFKFGSDADSKLKTKLQLSIAPSINLHKLHFPIMLYYIYFILPLIFYNFCVNTLLFPHAYISVVDISLAPSFTPHIQGAAYGI